MNVRAITLIGALLMLAAEAPGQTVAFYSVDEFIRIARLGSERFQDVDAAIAAGYRRIGVDMPNMGEHWINPRIAVRNEVDPARPAVLTYLPVNGVRRLTGVAYTTVVRPDSEPRAPPVANAPWHFHASTVVEEASGGPAHVHEPGSDRAEASHGAGVGQRVDMGLTPDGHRLGMLHAWIWVDNPAGTFSPDNWALGYLRHGQPPPDRPEPDAARMLFLLAAGPEFYVDQARAIAGLGPEELDGLGDVLDRHRRAAGVWWQSAQSGATTDEEQKELAERWRRLWVDVMAQLDPLRHADLQRVAGS